jgi:hypothetical protein
MAEFNSVPFGALDDEARIVAIGRHIYGFKTAREIVARLDAAGYTPMQIGGAETAEAIRREYRRQLHMQERPQIHCVQVAPDYWTATFAGHKQGDPVGDGPTHPQAVFALQAAYERQIAATAAQESPQW